MGYAIKKNHTGSRGIPSDGGKYDKKEIADDEYYSESLDGIEFPLLRSEIDAMRVFAYADPVSGSDRHFSEALRLEAMGADGADEARAKGKARYLEIQSSYPWPEK